MGRLSRAAGGSFTLGAVGGVQVHHLQLGEVAAAPGLLPYYSHLGGGKGAVSWGQEQRNGGLALGILAQARWLWAPQVQMTWPWDGLGWGPPPTW